MSVGSLVSNAFARRRSARMRAAAPPMPAPLPVRLLDGTVDVEAELRLALNCLGDVAEGRDVVLQMAAEADLIAQADLGCQRCLRDLIALAIGRAESGVLATAVRRDDKIVIEVVDDGAARSLGAVALPDGAALPAGATVSVESQADGTKVMLCLPSVPAAAAKSREYAVWDA